MGGGFHLSSNPKKTSTLCLSELELVGCATCSGATSPESQTPHTVRTFLGDPGGGGVRPAASKASKASKQSSDQSIEVRGRREL